MSMDDCGVSEPVRRFIFASVDSIDQLDVLLLLHGHAAQALTAQQVSEALRTNLTLAKKSLAHLLQRGLLVEEAGRPGAYQYQPMTTEMAAVVDELAHTCAIRRHRLHELIFSPLKRARHFSKSFVVTAPTEDDKDG